MELAANIVLRKIRRTSGVSNMVIANDREKHSHSRLED